MTTPKVHSELEENFLSKPSMVNDLIKFIIEVAKSTKVDGGKEKESKAEVDISAGVTNDNFSVMERHHYANKRAKTSSRNINVRSNMNQMTFMRQIDMQRKDRIKAREERIIVANNFRRLGNAEYRKTAYDKAIQFYTKGLEYISDSPVLYVNRSLCFIKKREFKRALIDLDYVTIKLDKLCLRAWLYRAGAMKRMNNEAGFEQCIETARRLNRQELEYIDYFLTKMRTDF